MNCRECEQHLSGYLDDALAVEESASIAMHLELCEACNQQLEELLALKQLLKNAETPKAGPDFWGRTLPEIAPEAKRRRRSELHLIRLRVAEAAIAVVVIGLALAQFPSPDVSSEPPMPRVQVASFDPASLVSLHASVRATRPLADTGKVRFAMSEGDSRDYATDNALDSL
jgi:anti-sigma factor RsiW